MTGETELLLSKIKGIDKIAYHLMLCISNAKCFGLKEFNMRSKLDNRLYKIFLKFIDKESAKRLKAIDALIDEEIQNITDGNNWSVNQYGAEMIDNYQNWEDYEFRTCDIHRILRDESGYYVEEATIPYEEYLNTDSIAFLNSHRKQFEDLHRLYFEKESIMRGNYSLRGDSSDYDTPRLISSYLGYYREKALRRKLVG